MPLATNPFTQEVAAGNAQIGRWLSLCSKFVAEVTQLRTKIK